jgi:hypothetical protein
MSFAAALCASTQQQQTPHHASQACNSRVAEMGTPATVQHQHKESGQSAQESNVNSGSLDNMFRVANVVQQIMTGRNDAVRRRKNSGHY